MEELILLSVMGLHMAQHDSPFSGVNCPLITPFKAADSDEAGTVDTDALASLVESLLDAGLDGLVPCGTTGEFASLSDDEFRIVLETTVDAADGHIPVMAGAAATTVQGTIDRLTTAAEAGADAGLVVLPYFHTANASTGNERFLRSIAAETPLPIYLYNIPACTGQAISPETVVAVAEEESVRGLKDSWGDFNYFTEVVRRTPTDFHLYQGFDSYFVSSLTLGATGGINALTNAIPETFVAAAEAVRTGDRDRARQIHATQIAPLFQQCIEHGFAPAAKVAAAMRGFVPSATVRPPLVELDTDAQADIKKAVNEIAAEYE
jgi:4-hydroxy-tetrahydrodipicolinate synthase